MSINIGNFLQTLPIMGWGMLGIFIVLGIIYLIVAGFNLLGQKRSKK